MYTKAIARLAGLSSRLNSLSFSSIDEISYRPNVVHFDAKNIAVPGIVDKVSASGWPAAA
jgi:hypothetical protein